jgi:hypothetical protein
MHHVVQEQFWQDVLNETQPLRENDNHKFVVISNQDDVHDTIYNVAVILVLLIRYFYLLQHSLCCGINWRVQIECSSTANSFTLPSTTTQNGGTELL